MREAVGGERRETMDSKSSRPAERRGARRIRLRQPMHIGLDDRKWVAFCLDVSVSGIGAWSSEAVPEGETINASFRIGDSEFEVEAEVVRCEPTTPARLGLRITRLHPGLLNLLEAA
ncbi:MAG: PilZ domain-containing protein [Myxococcota bacterium]